MPQKRIKIEEHEINKEQFLSPAQIALLSILAEQAAHATYLMKVIDDRGYENWVDMKKSIIYKSLGILERKKLIKGKKEVKDKVAIKTYTITGDGLQKIREQVKLCLRRPPRSKSLFDLGLAGISLLSKSEALSALEEYQKDLDNSIVWFEQYLKNMNNVNEIVQSDPDQVIVGDATAKEFQTSRYKFAVKALFERPYYIVKAQKEWLEGFIQSIREDDGEFAFREV